MFPQSQTQWKGLLTDLVSIHQGRRPVALTEIPHSAVSPLTTLTLRTGHPVSPILLTWAHGVENVGWGPLESWCSLCLLQSAETELWDSFFLIFYFLFVELSKPLRGILYINGRSLRWQSRNQRNPWERCFSPTAHPSVTLVLKPRRDKAHKSSEKYKHYQMSDLVTVNYF